jgi:hypothetical protein
VRRHFVLPWPWPGPPLPPKVGPAAPQVQPRRARVFTATGGAATAIARDARAPSLR